MDIIQRLMAETPDAILVRSSERAGGFNLFSSLLKRADEIRKREKKKKSAAGRKELQRIYQEIQSLTTNCQTAVFRETVPEKEITALFDHTGEILQQLIDNDGSLLKHDQDLLCCF